MPVLRRIAPEFPVSDVPKAIACYGEKLGFRLDMTMPEEDYAIVQRDEIAIHLFKAEQSTAPTSIHVFTEGLDDLHCEFKKTGARIKQDIVRQAWGKRDFRVLDDFGNEIKFTEI